MLASKKVDLDVVPQLNGVPLPDVDLESLDKPWQKPGQYDLLLPLLSSPPSLLLFLSLSLSPLSLSFSLFLNTLYNTSGSTVFFFLSLSPPSPPLPHSLFAPGADITDYFNYGFSEETWKLYCDKQRKMRYEATQLSKSVVSHTLTTKKYYHSTHCNNNNNNININIRMAIFVFLFQCLNVFLKLLKTSFDSLVNGHNDDYYFIHCLIWLWHKRPLFTCTSSRWL